MSALLLEEGRRRDALMEQMFNELSVQRNNIPVNDNENSTSTPIFRIMPDLSKDIGDFDGEGDSAKAREWFIELEV